MGTIMKHIPILLNEEKIKDFCHKHHLTYFALFGSILNSNFSNESDVDILIKFEQKHIPHLLAFVDMEFELADIVGRKVDLKTPNDLSPYFRDDVLSKAKIIYGK